jgi:hypothetical protein
VKSLRKKEPPLFGHPKPTRAGPSQARQDQAQVLASIRTPLVWSP